ncbi:1-deoxy-D-xylulose-5-phosphate synthase [Aeromicrobium wangtongii]|uniref:1-deoxy-D-xylulose-5-phosphate synthase n=1 Tax=Aeromicrobium wangtongii TaxID=2969247 RepID=A0ABY5MB10_9ACTN|nr:1-deoxy-D-xylulose-5-phosphate synthase [Aeromicrobium wangtongii]MCD9197812.1 1-deoxy-D-xylulose-5-phosphate synthase [Aeromicrobium wangtongii]UUP15293.1 1-deoxy-D-xylulose-5-phosphate synthase [Aeromicrobium wangtongii]
MDNGRKTGESILDHLSGPADLRGLDDDELTRLAAEIRELLITTVAANGGHLGPNLGVVELGIAIHRVFESPADRVVWDTGHQSYVHKMLTGRAGQFATLRKEGGLSGYPCQAESEHDWVENSHASTSLSYADGMAKANALLGKDDHVVAVIGDGALTGGMAWEALNNIAADQDRRLVVIVNDNGRSYTPTVGGLANRLTTIRTNPKYEPTLSAIKDRLNRTRFGGTQAYEALHAIKKGVKDALAPQGMFEDLGLKYIGPVDGHDRASLEHALTQAKRFGGPVMVHVLTTKGHGYDIAVANENDQMHQAGPFDRATGDALNIAPAGWTSVFRDEIVRIADERPDVVGITAAMLYPVGLDAFADKFPDRVFDVGIAEQHAVTSAAGLAMGGLHPVVAVYATFINRAFDQVLLDVALHKCGVTFVLDRAGVTGDDGASHNGMWDMSLLQIVPGLRLAAPRDGSRLRELLREAVDVDDAPTVVRFAKGAVCEDIPALERVGVCDVLSRDETADVLVVAVGAFAQLGLDVAELLRAQGHGVTVVDPRWVKPIDPELVRLAADHRLVVTLEDNGRQGGVGAAFTQAVRDAEIDTPIRVHGVEQEFLDHAKRDVILQRLGLTAQSVADDALAALGRNSAEG